MLDEHDLVLALVVCTSERRTYAAVVPVFISHKVCVEHANVWNVPHKLPMPFCWHVQFVSSAANCQLSCTLSLLSLSCQLKMLLELSAFSSFRNILPSCILSAPLCMTSLTGLYKFGCSESAWL